MATWTTLLYLVERLPLKAFIIAWRIVAAYGVDWRVWRVWIEEEQPVHRVCFLVLLCSWQRSAGLRSDYSQNVDILALGSSRRV